MVRRPNAHELDTQQRVCEREKVAQSEVELLKQSDQFDEVKNRSRREASRNLGGQSPCRRRIGED